MGKTIASSACIATAAALALTAACGALAQPSRADRASLSDPSALTALVQNPAVTANLANAAIFPLADHHQHLMSPANLAGREQPPRLPTVDVPPDLDRLLLQRGAVSGSTLPNDLFTEDAQLLRILQGDWAKGPKDIQEYLGFVTKGLKYRPTIYHLGDSSGFVAGTVVIGEPANDVLNFVMGVRKGADGKWRIAAESATVIPAPDYPDPITADDLITNLDNAGISRAVVHSLAYSWASQNRSAPVENEYDKVRAENDWTVSEVSRHATRLIAFCGVNPLREYALAELDRCAKLPNVKGVKLHFHNSGVDLKKADHLEKLRRFFAAANANGLAIMAHLFTGGDYGPEDSRIFIANLLPAAPDVTVQIAHLAGSGPGFDGSSALAVFAERFAERDPRLKNVYIDVAGVVPNESNGELIVKQLRQIGIQRILFGSDMHPNPPPLVAWSNFRTILPLADHEVRQVASNVAPYMR